MRAVWFAYTDLHDLLGGKSVQEARQALDTAMKRTKDFGCNTVIFHVRANSDAYYSSSLFPIADKVKDLIAAGFDPLAEAIAAAHRYGLSLHAWVNPYRIGKKEENARCADRFYYDARWYYVPTSAAVQKLILDGVRELMAYDIDGLQFDDYFYPKSAFAENERADFEQTLTVVPGQTVGDARRAAVSALVRSTYQIVHQKKGRVFGVSPSHSIETNVELVYADVPLWMCQSGYVDYICPQIYFGFQHESAPFADEVKRWAGYERHSSVALYAGLALYKTGIDEDVYAGSGRAEWGTYADVMKRQVLLLRNQTAFGGFMLFRYAHLSATAPRDSSFSKTVTAKELTALRSIL